MKLKNPIREIRKAMTPPCTQCVHSRFKAFNNVTILCKCGAYLDHVERTCYPREFWKDNKKRAGEVCEKCRNEIDYDQVRRRKAKAGEAS